MFDKLIVASLSIVITFALVITLHTIVKNSPNASQVIATQVLNGVK